MSTDLMPNRYIPGEADLAMRESSLLPAETTFLELPIGSSIGDRSISFAAKACGSTILTAGHTLISITTYRLSATAIQK